MGRADIHIHTRVSDGMASVAETLAHVEERTTLDVIAVTDHEDARGGLEARELAARRGLRVEVIPGAEVTTRQGHLLALFIERTPPIFRSVEATLEAIHAQGGIAVAAHPMSWLTRSLSARTIDRVTARNEAGATFDAIEANFSPAGRVSAGARRGATRNAGGCPCAAAATPTTCPSWGRAGRSSRGRRRRSCGRRWRRGRCRRGTRARSRCARSGWGGRRWGWRGDSRPRRVR